MVLAGDFGCQIDKPGSQKCCLKASSHTSPRVLDPEGKSAEAEPEAQSGKATCIKLPSWECVWTIREEKVYGWCGRAPTQLLLQDSAEETART